MSYLHIAPSISFCVICCIIWYNFKENFWVLSGNIWEGKWI